jgi:HEAT repeat protein
MRRIAIMSVALLAVGCGPRSTDGWIQRLKDPDVVKRRQAVRELGERTGDAQRVVPALADALSDENDYVRRDAARALGKFGVEAREALPALQAVVKDKEAHVRVAAADALKKIDPQAAAKAGVR